MGSQLPTNRKLSLPVLRRGTKRKRYELRFGRLLVRHRGESSWRKSSNERRDDEREVLRFRSGPTRGRGLVRSGCCWWNWSRWRVQAVGQKGLDQERDRGERARERMGSQLADIRRRKREQDVSGSSQRSTRYLFALRRIDQVVRDGNNSSLRQTSSRFEESLRQSSDDDSFDTRSHLKSLGWSLPKPSSPSRRSYGRQSRSRRHDGGRRRSRSRWRIQSRGRIRDGGRRDVRNSSLGRSESTEIFELRTRWRSGAAVEPSRRSTRPRLHDDLPRRVESSSSPSFRIFLNPVPQRPSTSSEHSCSLNSPSPLQLLPSSSNSLPRSSERRMGNDSSLKPLRRHHQRYRSLNSHSSFINHRTRIGNRRRSGTWSCAIWISSECLESGVEKDGRRRRRSGSIHASGSCWDRWEASWVEKGTGVGWSEGGEFGWRAVGLSLFKDIESELSVSSQSPFVSFPL